ncbi:MAG: hypothetical protein KKA05_10675, partial [Alphaproteobacteria bacterium]|nr:hypothetical protein [Alphaproteobacteria bacterium]
GETVYKIFYEGDTYKKIENGIVKFSYTAPCESNTLTDKATLTGYYYFWSGTGTTETIDYKWVK